MVYTFNKQSKLINLVRETCMDKSSTLGKKYQTLKLLVKIGDNT
jgi:hypothetical protein